MDLTERKITKIAREVNKFTVKTLKADGIGSGEFDVIHTIRKNPGISQSGICNILGIDKAAVARETNNLEKKGYIIKNKNEADKRGYKLYATKKAENLKTSKASIESSFYEWLLNSLEENEKEIFLNCLDKIYISCKQESKSSFHNIEAIIKK